MKKVKILITGANGFIGSSLSNYFHYHHYQVVGISRKSNIKTLFQTVTSDYSTDELAHIIDSKSPQYIIHAAGTSSVGDSITNPKLDFDNSVLPFLSLLEAVRVSKNKPRIYFLSSAAVYGNPKIQPINETTPLNPISPYGYHKQISEQLAFEFANVYKIPLTILRFFSVFGPLQKNLLIWELYQQMAAKDQVTIDGTGEESRDYLHIEDLYNIFQFLLDLKNPPQKHILNIASGNSIKINKLVQLMSKVMKTNKSIIYKNNIRIGNPIHWEANITKLRSVTNQNLHFDFEKRLEATINIWQKSKS